tara:strand:+ start:524 stop:826 length:303 start_codon:yes stop_codon:yes gene_type:complete
MIYYKNTKSENGETKSVKTIRTDKDVSRVLIPKDELVSAKITSVDGSWNVEDASLIKIKTILKFTGNIAQTKAGDAIVIHKESAQVTAVEDTLAGLLNAV